MKDANYDIINRNERELKQLPLIEWPQRIKKLQEEALVVDVSSAQARLDELVTVYGKLPLKNLMRDLLSSDDQRFFSTFSGLDNVPNQLQFANAQFAVFGLRNWAKQLWCIPSGQGKSRVIATMTLILLLTESTSRVHLVYNCQHLKRRDEKEFTKWWTLTSLKDKIQYHGGLDFQCQNDEIVIIDEADEFLFSDTLAFDLRFQDNNCICLTATPGQSTLERRVVETLGFKAFDGLSKIITSTDLTTTVTSACTLKVSEILKMPADKHLVAFIQKELLEHPVLIYCTEEFKSLVASVGLIFISVDDNGSFDDELLRNLDKSNEGVHTLLIASTTFGMRGLDYRSPLKGITLIIAASFSDERSLLQGLNRVGRFGDPCKRVRLEGIDLINQSKQLQLLTDLNKFFFARNSKHNTVFKLPPIVHSQSVRVKKNTHTDSKQQILFGTNSKLPQARVKSLFLPTTIPKEVQLREDIQKINSPKEGQHQHIQ